MDVSDFFYFYFVSGEGKGQSEAPGGGGVGCIEKSQEGGGGLQGGGPRGREGLCSKWRIGGGGRGLNICFGGPKCPPRIETDKID